jgi:DNA-binding MurR/RpiR family transcriptional regulator
VDRAGLALRGTPSEDGHTLERTLQAISGEQFGRVVALVRGANRVTMFDLGSSGFLAGFAAYHLLSLRPNVSAITDSGDTIYRQPSWPGEDDPLLACRSPRYSRATVETCRYTRPR